MPLALKLLPIEGQFEGCRSVMLVACNVCPRMHVAWRDHQPLLSMATLLGREDGFQRYLAGLQQEVRRRGHRCEVFRTSSTTAACLWTTALGRKFRRAGAR